MLASIRCVESVICTSSSTIVSSRYRGSSWGWAKLELRGCWLSCWKGSELKRWDHLLLCVILQGRTGTALVSCIGCGGCHLLRLLAEMRLELLLCRLGLAGLVEAESVIVSVNRGDSRLYWRTYHWSKTHTREMGIGRCHPFHERTAERLSMLMWLSLVKPSGWFQKGSDAGAI